MSAEMVRVLLVDDHVVVRSGLAALLCSLGNYLIVGQAANGQEALRLAGDARPDLVLMDLSMPRLNGIEATRQLRESNPGLRVLVLSMHEDEGFVAQALLAGANGYVVKQSTPEELRLAMQTVAAGGVFISPAVAGAIVEEYLRQARVSHAWDGEVLSSREREVLQLIAEGHTASEIADILTISQHTAQHHRAHIKRKLGAHNDAEIVKIALQKNLILPQ